MKKILTCKNEIFISLIKNRIKNIQIIADKGATIEKKLFLDTLLSSTCNNLVEDLKELDTPFSLLHL